MTTASKFESEIIQEILEFLVQKKPCSSLIQSFESLRTNQVPRTTESTIPDLNDVRVDLNLFEIPRASQQKNQPLVDHLILLILYSSGTIEQKIQSFFLVLSTLDPAIQATTQKELKEVYLLSSKDFIHRATELLGVPIPYPQISDTIEKSLWGFTPSILSAILVLIEKNSRKEMKIDVISLLKELSKINHCIAGTRNLFLTQEAFVFSLLDYYLNLHSIGSLFISSKLVVLVQPSNSPKFTEEFVIDAKGLNSFLEKHKEEKSPSKPVLDFSSFGNFSNMMGLLNSQGILIKVDDINIKIDYPMFRESVLSIPVLNWALSASHPMSQEPFSMESGPFPKEVLLQTFSMANEPIYKAKLIVSGPNGFWNPIVIDCQSALEEILGFKEEFKKGAAESDANLGSTLSINACLPISAVLEQLDYLYALNSIQKEKFSKITMEIFDFVKRKKTRYSTIFEFSNGEKRQVDTANTFLEAFHQFSPLFQMDRLKIEARLT